MEYILSDKRETGTGCLFCNKNGEGRDRDNLILYRSSHSFIILNLYPYNNGHLMVVPYAHTSNVDQLDAESLADMMLQVKRSVSALRRAMNPNGFNIGINIGHAAGAGVADHVHMHVVPRWVGDSNFIPVLAETRLIPEDLNQTYERLIEAGIAAE
jgi:ATP adenylyltransferase